MVNADDYGWNQSCSNAILESFEKGYIDTTTAIVTTDYFDNAVESIKSTPFSDKVGIHFNLTEGKPVTEEIKNDYFFCDENGMFHGEINRYKKLSSKQRNMVYDELKKQAELFKKSGLKFHHADSHHHIHTAPYITPIVLQIMNEYQISGLRLHRNIGNIKFVKKSFKNLYNFYLSSKNLTYSEKFGSFDDLNNYSINKDDCVLEIMCHPDFDVNGVLVDRDGEALYESPFGISMIDRFNMISKWKV
jgi:hypothetical protein